VVDAAKIDEINILQVLCLFVNSVICGVWELWPKNVSRDSGVGEIE